MFWHVRFYLFLKSTGHQPPELWQAVVDPVSTPLLYDLCKKDKQRDGQHQPPPKTNTTAKVHDSKL